MALNKFMHPRNPYRDKAPNFKALAQKYPEFAKCVFQDLKGKCHLDYKSPASLRQLAIALLKEDFDLEVEMPLNRLIPTIPLRLNYILWIEDMLKELNDVQGKGLDIGMYKSFDYHLKLHMTKLNKYNYRLRHMVRFKDQTTTVHSIYWYITDVANQNISEKPYINLIDSQPWEFLSPQIVIMHDCTFSFISNF